ncbi:MAG: hypothetical protein ACM3VW_05295 [Bacteroidota bacterium]
MRRGGRGGFSLGELFFAMSIIMIGGGIVIMNSQRAYRPARAASCMSNVKQLATAMRIYCNDWGRAPGDPRDFGALMSYTKNVQVFICPSQKEPSGKVSHPVAGGPQDVRTDYLLNPQMRLDDAPGLVVVGDDRSNRHMGRYWIGARLDSAGLIYPASEWQSRLGGVIANAPPPGP